MTHVGVVDSHVHFWDPRLLDYPWLGPMPGLNRPFLPQDLDAGSLRLDGMIVVQADCAWPMAQAEVAWIQALARAGAPIRGMVAAAALERGDACATELVALAAQPLVVGVRRLLQDEPAGFALQPDFVAGTRLLSGPGLVSDLCVRHYQLPEVTELVRRCPEVTFVLDHLGKPDIASGSRREWATNLSRLAALANVSCKLSGLTSEADENTRRSEHIRPYLHHAIEVFGPGRCMFGGDWPVASLTIGYEAWWQLVDEATSGLSGVERDLIMGGTVTRVYAGQRSHPASAQEGSC